MPDCARAAPDMPGIPRGLIEVGPLMVISPKQSGHCHTESCGVNQIAENSLFTQSKRATHLPRIQRAYGTHAAGLASALWCITVV